MWLVVPMHGVSSECLFWVHLDAGGCPSTARVLRVALHSLPIRMTMLGCCARFARRTADGGRPHMSIAGGPRGRPHTSIWRDECVRPCTIQYKIRRLGLLWRLAAGPVFWSRCSACGGLL